MGSNEFLAAHTEGELDVPLQSVSVTNTLFIVNSPPAVTLAVKNIINVNIKIYLCLFIIITYDVDVNKLYNNIPPKKK